MNKRLLSFLIIVVLVIGLVPTTMAQDDKPFKGMKVVV